MFDWLKMFDCRCSFLGGLFSGIGSIVGGSIQAQAQERINQQNIAMQKEFAQNGIQWKAKDAEKAGVHKLAALGAQTYQATPSSVAPDIGGAVANASKHFGQAIDDFIEDKSEERSLQLERMKLENDKLKKDLSSNTGQNLDNVLSPANTGSPKPLAIVGDISNQPKNDGYNAEQSLKVGYGLQLQKTLSNNEFLLTYDPESMQGQQVSEGYINQIAGWFDNDRDLNQGGLDKIKDLLVRKKAMTSKDKLDKIWTPFGWRIKIIRSKK